MASRVVVLSPHLDDAVLSLGAAIASWCRRGAEVVVATVLANDPEAEGPARPWDSACGYTNAGQAARERRREDRAACRLLGARPIWYPYGDREHGRGGSNGEIAAALAPLLDAAELMLVPGYPLAHSDHAWLCDLVTSARAGDARLWLYAEQPYASSEPIRAALHGRRPRLAPSYPAFSSQPRRTAWTSLGCESAAWVQKQRAIAAYRSQRRMLHPLLRARIAAYEFARRGESVAPAPS